MRRLPTLISRSGSWRLPLSDLTASGLLRAFLCDDLDQRRERIAALLADDPPLVLWTAICCQQTSAVNGESIESLSWWLSEQGVQELQWPESECSLQPSADEALRQRWSEMLAESLTSARIAAEICRQNVSGEIYLVAILRNAVAWLTSCGTPLDREHLADDPALHFLSAPAAFTAEWSEAANALDTAHAATAAAIAQRWRDTADASAAVLPAMMRKLARLAKLEVDFARTLETEKLAALKELAYGASHEINNPLANISTRAQTLLREETDPERRRKLAVINSQAFRAHEMISDMMLFARSPALHIATFDLTALVDTVLAELTSDAEAQGTQLHRVTSHEPLAISADRTQLAVALKSVCVNSLEALGNGGVIEVAVLAVEDAPSNDFRGPWFEIQIRDTGPGIPPEVRRHLFDPFFSGREAGRGLGLGLAKCWRIVTEHGGRIDVTSSPLRGTTFTIRLPQEACPHIRSVG